MPVVHAPETAYAKEMRKWEGQHSAYGAPGRPYQFQEFPKRLYRAERTAKGRIEIVEGFTANTPDEERNLQSRGFHFGQDAAIAAWERVERSHAELAAERAYAVTHTLSARAGAEVAAAEAAHGARHLPDIPETPVPAHRKRGRAATDATVTP